MICFEYCPGGGTGGYLYDKSEKNQEKACEKGVKVGQGSKPKYGPVGQVVTV